MTKTPPKNRFWHFRGIFIPLFMFLMILGSVFGIKTASAKVVEQTIDSTKSTLDANAGGWKYLYQSVGTGWSDGHYLVKTKYWQTGYFDKYPILSYNVSRGYSSQSKNAVSQQLLDTTGDIQTWLFDFGEITGINPDLEMIFYIGGTGPFDPPQSGPVGSLNLTYPNCWNIGYLFTNCVNTPFPDIKTFWFQITNTGSFPQNEIQITFPENSTTTPDFGAWRINYNLIETGDYYWAKIRYGTSSTTLDLIDTEPIFTGSRTNTIINKLNLLQEGRTYYAKAEIGSQNHGTLATSDLISFNISGGYVSNFYYYTPLPTSTSTELTITCDPESSFFEYSLCKLAIWLFLPDSAVLNKFSTLADEIKNKPPIGYYYAIKDVLSGFNSTSTPAFQLASVGPLTENIFNPLKTGISFILWLIFAFWIFNRIRHFEL